MLAKFMTILDIQGQCFNLFWLKFSKVLGVQSLRMPMFNQKKKYFLPKIVSVGIGGHHKLESMRRMSIIWPLFCTSHWGQTTQSTKFRLNHDWLQFVIISSNSIVYIVVHSILGQSFIKAVESCLLKMLNYPKISK